MTLGSVSSDNFSPRSSSSSSEPKIKRNNSYISNSTSSDTKDFHEKIKQVSRNSFSTSSSSPKDKSKSFIKTRKKIPKTEKDKEVHKNIKNIPHLISPLTSQSGSLSEPTPTERKDILPIEINSQQTSECSIPADWSTFNQESIENLSPKERNSLRKYLSDQRSEAEDDISLFEGSDGARVLGIIETYQKNLKNQELVYLIATNPSKWDDLILAGSLFIQPEELFALFPAHLNQPNSEENYNKKVNLLKFCCRWIEKNKDILLVNETASEIIKSIPALSNFSGELKNLSEEIEIDMYCLDFFKGYGLWLSKIQSNLSMLSNTEHLIDLIVTDKKKWDEVFVAFDLFNIPYKKLFSLFPARLKLQDTKTNYNRKVAIILFCLHLIEKNKGSLFVKELEKEIHEITNTASEWEDSQFLNDEYKTAIEHRKKKKNQAHKSGQGSKKIGTNSSKIKINLTEDQIDLKKRSTILQNSLQQSNELYSKNCNSKIIEEPLTKFPNIFQMTDEEVMKFFRTASSDSKYPNKIRNEIINRLQKVIESSKHIEIPLSEKIYSSEKLLEKAINRQTLEFEQLKGDIGDQKIIELISQDILYKQIELYNRITPRDFAEFLIRSDGYFQKHPMPDSIVNYIKFRDWLIKFVGDSINNQKNDYKWILFNIYLDITDQCIKNNDIQSVLTLAMALTTNVDKKIVKRAREGSKETDKKYLNLLEYTSTYKDHKSLRDLMNSAINSPDAFIPYEWLYRKDVALNDNDMKIADTNKDPMYDMEWLDFICNNINQFLGGQKKWDSHPDKHKFQYSTDFISRVLKHSETKDNVIK